MSFPKFWSSPYSSERPFSMQPQSFLHDHSFSALPFNDLPFEYFLMLSIQETNPSGDETSKVFGDLIADMMDEFSNLVDNCSEHFVSIASFLSKPNAQIVPLSADKNSMVFQKYMTRDSSELRLWPITTENKNFKEESKLREIERGCYVCANKTVCSQLSPDLFDRLETGIENVCDWVEDCVDDCRCALLRMLLTA